MPAQKLRFLLQHVSAKSHSTQEHMTRKLIGKRQIKPLITAKVKWRRYGPNQEGHLGANASDAADCVDRVKECSKRKNSEKTGGNSKMDPPS